MLSYRGLQQYPAEPPASVVAQGTFDGIHLGHQAVIRTAVERAAALGVRSVALTFDPHPVAVLRPGEPVTELLTLDERLEQISALGADAAVVIPFTPEFSRVEAEAFVREVLVSRLRAREVVVGFNHTFGRGARGNPAFLEAEVASLGVRVRIMPPLTVNGIVVSSSAIRQALRAGDVERAGALLGRPYGFRGRVARGAARGRELGFPTANLVPSAGHWLLASGVYAGHAAWDSRSAGAVINVGVRPTFGGQGLVVEAHLLGVAVELYDRELAVTFEARIREEMRFPSVEALRARIAEDVQLAHRLLGGA